MAIPDNLSTQQVAQARQLLLQNEDLFRGLSSDEVDQILFGGGRKDVTVGTSGAGTLLAGVGAGAAVGAGAGTLAAPVVGTIVGGVVGALAGGFASMLVGDESGTSAPFDLGSAQKRIDQLRVKYRKIQETAVGEGVRLTGETNVIDLLGAPQQ